MSDQLFGQTWAHLNGLGYIYPHENVKTALWSIWKYNWAPDVAAQNKIHPPERTYANSGEAGLLICTWPRSAHMGQNGVRYRDEVWTGIEYQVATNMIYEGMIDEAVSIVKGIHERYSPEKHNPWNEIECGDHYARALASWGVLIALEDFYYNGPQKIIGFAPKVQRENFESFFTSAEAWGNIVQKKTGAAQTNRIAVKYGVLNLSQIIIEPLLQPKKVRVYTRAGELACTYKFQEKKIAVSFKEVQLQKSEDINVVIDF